MHTMTKRQRKSGMIDVKALVAEDEEFLRALVRTALQEVLEAEMTEAPGAAKGERAAGRQGYRSGYYGRTPSGASHNRAAPDSADQSAP
jgi:putative transposase